MSPITTIPLDDQVVAILRVRRMQSVTTFHSSPDIAVPLERPSAEIVRVMADLYADGILMKQSVRGTYSYRLGSGAERTPGCCCCCDEKLFSSSRLFCETCAPEFDGRV